MDIDALQRIVTQLRNECRKVARKYPTVGEFAISVGDMGESLVSEIVRLTAENTQLVAANQALVTENARLVKRDQEARRIIEDADLCGGDIDRPAARAFLAGEGK